MSDELLLRIVTDPGVIADPYPLLRELRETAPVHKLGFADFWILTRFEDCRAALRDSRLGNPESGDDVPTLIAGTSRGPDGARSLLSLNPPDHTRIRSLVSRAFTPRRTERLRPAVEAMTRELLDPMAEAGECDLIEALAFPLPANVISELVGVPVADRDWLRPLVSDLAATLEPNRQPEETRQAAVSGAKIQAVPPRPHRPEASRAPRRSAVRADRNQRRRRPPHPAASVRHRVAHLRGRLRDHHEPDRQHGQHSLMRHPDQLARLRADRSLVPSAVDEVLRFEPPVQLDGRYVRADAEIGGHAIPRGHGVLTLLGAANRDPAVVKDPDRFDVGRGEVPMLSFGSGIHYCLGAALARLEGQVVLEALLDRFGNWTPLDDDPPWKPRFTLRGLASLPVALS